MRVVAAIIFAGGLPFTFTPRVHAESKAEIPPEVRRNIHERVDNGLTAGIIVGLVDSSGTSYYTYGRPRQGSSQSLDENTIFEIGSITKIFTSVVLTDLVKRGVIGLDDPIDKYLPDEVKVPTRNGKSITLKQLAEHTSGLPRLPSNFETRAIENPYAEYTTELLYDFLSGYQLQRDAGSGYEYSNLGFGLLGHILGRVSARPYEQLVVDRIAKPLEMEDTRITLSSAQGSRFAQGHVGDKPVGHWDFNCLAGCGALRSSAKDMVRFLAANLGLFKTELDPALRRVLSERRETGTPGLTSAMGWHISTRFGTEIIWHNGGTGGYHSFCGFAPDRGFGVVVLSNSTDDIDDLGFHLLEPRYELKRVRKVAAVPSSVLEKYVGYYEVRRGRIFHVTKEGDQLYVQLTGQARYPTYPESATKFFYKVVDAQITFDRDKDGKVTGLTLHQGGVDRNAKRLGPDYRPPAPRIEVPVAPNILKRYVGEYELAPGAVVKVTLENGKLMVQFPGQPRLQVFPDSNESFFYKGDDAQITFRRDAEGGYSHLILNRAGIGTYARRAATTPKAKENTTPQVE